MAKNLDDKIDYIKDRVEDVAASIHSVDKELAAQKASFNDHIKQDAMMFEEFKRMNNILQENTNSLKEHMQRTDMLEDLVRSIDARLSPFEQYKIESEAIKKYRSEKLKKIGMILGIIATIIVIITGIKTL
jgi:hypothetical protein